jgi:isoquinoline 1-oxidoreductase alpha subunit
MAQNPIVFRLNGREVRPDVEEDVPLLWVIREHIGQTGTKFGCGIGVCGSCTVHIDGLALRSCVVPVATVRGREVTTIEGLAEKGARHILEAWIDEEVPQCGYCQPGMIMSAAALLKDNPDPSDADINANVTNICRCGTFNRVRRGIHLAADINKRGESS